MPHFMFMGQIWPHLHRPSPAGSGCFIINIVTSLPVKRNSLFAKSEPHVRWGLVNSPSKHIHTNQTVMYPRLEHHLVPKTFKCSHYLNSGSVCNHVFFVGHLGDQRWLTWLDYQSHLELALYPHSPMECEWHIVGFFQITLSFVGQELRKCFGEAWPLWNFPSTPLLQNQKTDELL